MAEPLRNQTEDGPYRRPIEIEQQIDALVRLSGDERMERAAIVDRSDPGYVSSEALLYFLRQSRADNSKRNFETLYRILLKRVQKTLPGLGRAEGNLDAAVERASDSIERHFIEMIVRDRTSYEIGLDFFEVRFNAALVGLRRTALKKMYKEKSREAPAPDDGEIPGEFNRSGKAYSPYDTKKYSDPLYRIRLRDAISALPNDQRQVLILDMHGVPYTSKDPAAATIGSLVGCNEQTARNRRDRAYEALRIALEGGTDE